MERGRASGLARFVIFVVVFALAVAGTSLGQTDARLPLSLGVGLNCGDGVVGPRRCKAAGAGLARIEFSIGSGTDSMDRLVGAYAARGIRLQPLAGFYGRVPTSAQSRSLRAWALRFGPRGSFWKGRNDGRLAIRNIEFGNETSYPYQFDEDGAWWLSDSYAQRAQTYAQRVRDAAVALRGTGVQLLVQADGGGSSDPTWVQAMFAAVPNLDDYVHAWTVHPYGPNGNAQIDAMLAALAAVGASSSTPFSISEWGLATDNGRELSDNYGYPKNMTYAEAAKTLRGALTTWTQHYGQRFAQFILYQDTDQRASGLRSDREAYFGVLRRYGGDKQAYTVQARALLASAVQSRKQPFRVRKQDSRGGRS
jgi:hypothetical protein